MQKTDQANNTTSQAGARGRWQYPQVITTVYNNNIMYGGKMDAYNPSYL